MIWTFILEIGEFRSKIRESNALLRLLHVYVSYRFTSFEERKRLHPSLTKNSPLDLKNHSSQHLKKSIALLERLEIVELFYFLSGKFCSWFYSTQNTQNQEGLDSPILKGTNGCSHFLVSLIFIFIFFWGRSF